jgi:concentrative nucleoside transporter, CNT family
MTESPLQFTPPVHVATPRTWRIALLGAVLVLGLIGYLVAPVLGLRVQAALGVVAFICFICACSANLAAVNWRTVGAGLALQVGLALFILKFEVAGRRPGYEIFSAVAGLIARFLDFSTQGSRFVFGVLADQQAMGEVFGGASGFVFAFVALPTVIFISAVFTALYYLGILQWVVKVMARVVMQLLGTSGAETLAATANVFMGQTEAPIIVRPYVASMTRSELLAMMVGGMATISGGVMAVYIALGADPIAILTTSVMAAPCGLYLAKILLPETEEPVTRGDVRVAVETPHANIVDAVAAGASDGTHLAINIAAMLIAFLAFIAFFDGVLSMASPDLTLARVFGWVFSPVALLMGVRPADIPAMGDLLGTKLVANEFVAYVKLTTQYREQLDPRSYTLATFALTGFANLGSIGILLGGLGGMAPSRRGDLARLGGRALLGGFVATLINASIAAMLI